MLRRDILVSTNQSIFCRKLDSNAPPSGPTSLSHQMATVNKYKMNLVYNGQSKTSPNQNSSTVMKIVDEKVKKIEKLDKKDLKDRK